MFCDDCGHPLNENGICPICGFQKNNAPVNQQVHPPKNAPNQALGYNFSNSNYIGQQSSYQQQSQHQNYQYQNQQQNNYQYQSQQQNNYQYQNQQQNNYQYQNRQQYNYANQNAYQYQNVSVAKKKKGPVIFLASCSFFAIALIVFAVWYINRDIPDYTTDDDFTTENIVTHDPTTEKPHENPPEEPPQNVEPGTKTIMMYIVGSDLESKYDAASSDIEEILASNFDDDKINLLIYTGGCKDWDMSEIPDDQNAYLIIKDNELELVDKEEQKNMGVSDTLSDFLTYGYENYPAEQYSVIFWNHGAGSFTGYGYDELTDDCLTLSEINDAFANSPFQENNKLEWIGFDACLMATIETASTLSPYANYLIASQEPEPSWGWDYSFLGDIDDLKSGDEIGKIIVDYYVETSEYCLDANPFVYADITLSVLDLNKISAVEDGINSLFSKANTALDDKTYHVYSRIRSNTKEIASTFTGESSYDNVDLLDLAINMEKEFPNESLTLHNALSEFVVYNNTSTPNENGISIYYPYNAKQMAEYCVPKYRSFNFAGDYATYLENFSSMLLGEDVLTADWNPSTMIPVKNNDLTFSLELTPEQAATCQNAYYVISRADLNTPGNYVFVSLSTMVDMDSNNVVTANFDGNILYMQNDTTKQMCEMMYTEQESTEDYTRYLLSSILFNEDINSEDSMYSYFVLETTPDNPTGNILGAYPIANFVNSNGTEIFPERYEIDISEYQNIAFGYFTHEFTSEEDLQNFDDSSWSDLKLMYNSFPINDGFSTVMGGMQPNIPYFGMFIFEDTQGNRHCSNLVQLQ